MHIIAYEPLTDIVYTGLARVARRGGAFAV